MESPRFDSNDLGKTEALCENYAKRNVGARAVQTRTRVERESAESFGVDELTVESGVAPERTLYP